MTNYFVGDVLIIKNDITEKQFEILDLADGVIHLFDSVLGIKSSEKLNKISELKGFRPKKLSLNYSPPSEHSKLVRSMVHLAFFNTVIMVGS